ncbi:hypothetical protein ABZ912_58055 [Nonomuraea angiospora]|uniref:hypothetical protein n=1 Tax=Nonomuraea angiospora TaxID=46172 RepID=UPI0033CB4D0B
MRTIYGLINHGALDLCATFLVEHTSFPKSLKEAQRLVDSLKVGRESLGMKQPLRVSETTMAPVREFAVSGKRVESEFTSASFAVAMEVSISLESATQVIMEMIGQSHIVSRERATSASPTADRQVPSRIGAAEQKGVPALPVAAAPFRTVALPPPAMDAPGGDPRAHLARELERAHIRAGAPKYKDVQVRLAPLAASPGTLSGIFRGHRHPRWELMEGLLVVFGARPDDIDELWRPLWLRARECVHPVGALPAVRLSAVADRYPDMPPTRALRQAPAAG